MNKEEERIERVNDSSDEDIEFEEPKPWKEEPQVNSDNEVVGLIIKRNAKLFRINLVKVVGFMKKRMRAFEFNGTQI